MRLQPGDWPAGAIGQITYNGTSWELYSIAGPSIFARVAPGSYANRHRCVAAPLWR